MKTVNSVAFSVPSCWFLIANHVSFLCCLLNTTVRKCVIQATTSAGMVMLDKVPKTRFTFKINVKFIKEKKKDRLGFHPKFECKLFLRQK